MKVIKLRAWDGVEMHRVDQIVLHPSCSRTYGSHILDENNDVHQLCDIVLMQYMGLKDRNEDEIYEGDILKNHLTGNIGFVKFIYGSYDVFNKITICSAAAFVNDGTEIIGNVHQHPQLLEK